MRNTFATSLLFLIILIVVMTGIAQTDSNSPMLEQQLIREQINNQKAQATYYEKQINSKTIWESLAPALASTIGTLIGATLALFGVRWSSNRQWKLEQERWIQTKKDESIKDIRVAAAELSKKIAAEVQTMMWLTWIAKYETEALSEKDIASYNREMKTLFKEDVAAQALLAALDTELHNKIKPLVKDVADIDHRISFTIKRFKQSQDVNSRLEAAKELGGFHNEVYGFYESMPDKLGNIFAEKKEFNVPA